MADAVDLTGQVNGYLTNLVVTREKQQSGKHVVKAEWKIPAYLNAPDYGRRLTSVDAYVDFICSPDNETKVVEVWQNFVELYEERKDINKVLNYDHYFVRGLEKDGRWTAWDGSSAGEELLKPYDRNRYYPKSSKKCTGIKVGVHGVNGYGGYDDTYLRGPNVYQTFSIQKPQQPVCEWVGWNEKDNYAAEYTIDANPDDDDEAKNNRERYDTRYRVLRQDNLPNTRYASRKVVTGWITTADSEVENSIAAPSELRSLQDGQWVEFTLEAYSRGMAGDSLNSAVSIVASRPARAAIKSISVSAVDMVSGIVTVRCSIPSDAHRWTTKAKLQRAKDVNPKWDAQRVAADASWEDVSGMVQIDDEYKDATWTTGFCDSVASAYPSGVNLKTWYRVVTENDLYFGDNAYMSTPMEAKQLFREQTATNDKVYVESISTNEDATAVRVLLGWPNDDSTGTEVSWSVHEDAWESSEQPSTALVTWKDATSQGSHANSASFSIYGVEQGVKLYVKARRYFEDEDGSIVDYSPYSTASSDAYWPYVPAMPPSELQLVAPTFVPKGSDVPLTWTFQSDAPQTAWAVYVVEDGERRAIMTGEDAYGACTVPASMLSGGSAKLVVSMTTGSEWADSQEAEVMFADPPQLAVTYPTADDPDYETTYPLLLEQPMTLFCESDTGNDMLHVRVVSNGIEWSTPDAELSQADGEPVFDAWVQPSWGEADGSYFTSVTLPSDVPFVDVGVYTWEVTSQNNTTGMLSEARTGPVKVRWAHQAHTPGDGTQLIVWDEARAVEVIPAAPDNISPSDVLDLYRVTPDGIDLVAEGVRYGSVLMDKHAPFGEGSYRVCTRTVDGDIAWKDFPYALKCGNLRFDWGGKSVELPYNVVRQDSWSKDFEERAHLDGKRSGFWNAGASRSASLSTDMFRFGSREDQELVRDLATFAGPVFVRLPNGCSYQANVDVNGMDESYQSGAVSVSFNATQVMLTDAFRIASSEIDTANATDYDMAEHGRNQVIQWAAAAPRAGQSFELMDEPSGDVKVELTASHDHYSDTWSVPNTVSGKTLELGTFPSELQAFISQAMSEGASIRLVARYDVEEG